MEYTILSVFSNVRKMPYRICTVCYDHCTRMGRGWIYGTGLFGMINRNNKNGRRLINRIKRRAGHENNINSHNNDNIEMKG
ncbi:MAG: hypothetical protein ACOYI7_10165, partial [Candidatus Excrementavichristensenella sp.]